MKVIKIPFFILCILFSVKSFSQIKVKSNGAVSVMGYNPNVNYNLSAQVIYSDTSRAHSLVSNHGYIYESVGFGHAPESGVALKIESISSNKPALYVIGSNGDDEDNPTVYVNGHIKATAGITPGGSDFRIKKNIRNLNSNTLFEKLSRIRGKKYRFKNKKELIELHNSGVFKFDLDTIYKKKKTVNQFGDTIRVLTKEIKKVKIDVPMYRKGVNYGVIAQDVEAQFPELASVDGKTGVMGVNYSGFIPILIEGINLQQEQITEMSKELKNLKKELEEIKKSSN